MLIDEEIEDMFEPSAEDNGNEDNGEEGSMQVNSSENENIAEKVFHTEEEEGTEGTEVA